MPKEEKKYQSAEDAEKNLEAVFNELNKESVKSEAVKTDGDAEKKVVKKSSAPKVKKAPKGKKYVAAKELVAPKKKYELSEALELVKKTSYTKFDGSVEVHIHTSLKKGQELLRGLIVLPGGSSKTQKIAVADDAMIENIKAGKIDFDVLIATPDFMPKLATVARILGPKGLMPSPKSGTVVEDPKTALAEFSKGRVEYKSDTLGNIHVGVGKVSWDTAKLVENVTALIAAMPNNRIMNVSISATMGPGIKIK